MALGSGGGNSMGWRVIDDWCETVDFGLFGGTANAEILRRPSAGSG